ncbi:MAG TPA: hypothetical protein VFS07_00185 [Gemmatimonadales bacterium]|nr:hypothetical protein [Gemmatimonadales bacterium]
MRPFQTIALAALLATPAATLHAQGGLEGSKWSVEQQGTDSVVVWWLGSQARVRTGDLGIILPGYAWRETSDSVWVTVGDSLTYAAALIGNRLVGTRVGPGHREGWWTGTLVSAAPGSALAAAPTQPSEPAAEPLSRPVEGSDASPPAGPRRTLRRIDRADAPADPGASQSGAREIRPLRRPGAQPLAPTAPVEAAALVGSWVPAGEQPGLRRLEFRADGTARAQLPAREVTGRWSNGAEGTVLVLEGQNDAEATLRVWLAGDELRAVFARAPARRAFAFRRAPAAGPALEPAQPRP